MYDDAGGDPGPAPVGVPGFSRFNLEGLIPLVLLVIIGIASLNYFGVIDIPFLPRGAQHMQVLYIGQPTLGEKVVLDNLTYMLTYRVMNAASFGNNPGEELSQYDLVILNQTLTDKSVSVAFGEAVKNYVQKGGKLVIVSNSGIYQSVGFGGYTSTDVVGWRANFGEIVPVECILGPDSVPVCAQGREINVVGRIRRQVFDHPIMMGIELSPPVTQPPYTMRVLDVQTGQGSRTIAYIQSENTPKSYPAIVEKKSFPFGTVVYFNYDPGLTPGILTNTIRYLR